MSEFMVIVELVGKIVTYLFNVSLDFICSAFLVTACILPWRCLEIICVMRSENNYRNEFRFFCCVALCMTIADAFVIPFALVGLLSPFRWSQMFWTFKGYQFGLQGKHFPVREGLVGCGIGAVMDFVCLFMGMFMSMSLFGRQCVVFRYISMCIHESRIERSPYYDQALGRNDLMKKIDKYVFKSALSVMIDSLCLIPFVLTCMIPFNWHSFGLGVKELLQQRPDLATRTDGTAVNRTSHEWERVWEPYYDEFRVHFLSHALRSVIDFGLAPFYLLATISPLRSSLMRKDIKDLLAVRDAALGEGPQEVGRFTYRYCWEVREKVLSYGTLAIADLLLLPMLLPLFVAQYRYKSIKHKLIGEDAAKIWGFYEFSLIASQFSLQLLDLLILLPCLPLVLLTAVRWKPIGEMMRRDNVFLDHSLELYTLTVTQLSTVVLDLLFLPLTLIVLLTHYRSKPVKQCWTSHVIWYKEPLTFHFAVFVNFLIIVGDVCFIMPLMLAMMVVGLHRVPIIADEMYTEYNKSNSIRRSESTSVPYIIVQDNLKAPLDLVEGVVQSDANTEDVVSPPNPPPPTGSPECHRIESRRESDEVIASPAWEPEPDKESPPVKVDGISSQVDTRVSLSKEQQITSSSIEFTPTNDIRVNIVIQFLTCWIDAIFALMALFVLVTVWRAYEMVCDVQSVWTRAKADAPVRGKVYIHFLSNHYERIGKAIANHFGRFWVDLLCLLPLSLVVVTLYRLPSLVTGLLGKLSSQPLKGDKEALFLIEKCDVIQPPTGGPTVQMTLKRNPRASTVVSLDASAPVELFVVGESLFSAIESEMGSLVVNIVRALLPVKFKESTKTIGWNAFLEQLNGSAEAEVGKVETDKVGTYNLWVRLDLSKTTKKTSIIKKLKALGNSTVIDMQMECYANIAISSGAMIRNKELLVRLSPSVIDMLTAIEDKELGELPASCLNYSPERETIGHSGGDASNDRKGSFVNSFHLVVLMEVKELFEDFYYFLLVLGSVMSPYRFIKLIWMILEPESALPVRTMEEGLKIVNHLDRHVQEFKLAESPRLNVLVKAQLEYDLVRFYRVQNSNGRDDSTIVPAAGAGASSLYRRSYYGYYQSYFNYMYNYNDEAVYNRGICEEMESAHIKPYRKAILALRKVLSNVDRCELIAALINARVDLHDKMLQLFFTRVACSAQLLGCYNTYSTDTNANQANNYNVAMSLLTQEYDAVVVALVKNRKELLDEIDRQRQTDSPTGKKKGWLSRCGLFKRPQSVTRWMIKRAFTQATVDVGFVALTAIVLLTLVRAVPLVRDLWRHRTWNVTGYQGKLIVRRHLVNLFYDLWHISRLLVFQFLLVATVTGLPSYLVNAPMHVSSFRDAADCASKHCRNILWYFCEVFALIFAFKSYRIFFKASLYVLLVPAACVAETIYFTGFNTHVKFGVGFAAWIGLLAGAIRTVIVAYDAGTVTSTGASSATTPWDSDRSLLILCGCLLVVLFLAVVSLLRNKDLLAPDRHASLSFEMTWSHLLSLVCGPLESLQLSAVVMFFYWSGRSDSGTPLTLGTDNFSSAFLVWGGAYEGRSHGYYDSTSLAAAAILLWSLMVSIPMALNNANSTAQRNWEKASQFKNSAAYQFIVNMISRLFSVWIMATLMRSVSCYYSSGSTAAVLSTAADVSCGGDHSRSLWSSRLSLVLFTYFIITSAVLHSDDYTFMQLNEQFGGGSVKDPQDSLVKFSPLYVLLVKAVQLFVCAACCGGFYAASSVGPLVAIIIVSLAVSAVPLLLPHEACSLAMVTPLRSAGFLCVAWTGIVCAARSTHRDREGTLRFESFVYVGWGIIYGLALIVMVVLEVRQRRLWEERMKTSGLNESIDKLLTLLDAAFVDNALMRTSTSGVLVTSSMGDVIRSEVRGARSTTQLARVLLFLEDLVNAERLTIPFLIERTHWIGRLKSAVLVEEEPRVQVSGRRERLNRFERAVSLRRASNTDDDLVVEDISEGDPTTTVVTANGTAAVEEEEEASPISPTVTPQFRLILTHISQLSRGLRPSSCLSQFSREVFTILLSNHLPRDVCWVIYSYLINPEEVRRILHMHDSEISEVSIREDYFYRYSRVGTWPRLETKPGSKDLYTENMLRYSMSFVANRRDLIFAAQTKQYDWETQQADRK